MIPKCLNRQEMSKRKLAVFCGCGSSAPFLRSSFLYIINATAMPNPSAVPFLVEFLLLFYKVAHMPPPFQYQSICMKRERMITFFLS